MLTEAIDPVTAPASPKPVPAIIRCNEHTVEIVSDAGEGAQKCGQIFAAVSARMGNGIWTVEIIPGDRFTYALRREGTDRRFRVEFDLRNPVIAPPAPWGAP